MVTCDVCPESCELDSGQFGKCRVRKERGGAVIPIAQNWASSLCYDPVEKKNLYHWYPGSYVLGLGSWGCSFGCRYCQNSRISQTALQIDKSRWTPPEDLLSFLFAREECVGVHFGYSEPALMPEWIEEVAEQVHPFGFEVLLGTNGYLTDKTIDRLLPHVGVWSLSFRGFDAEKVTEITRVDGQKALDAAKNTLRRVHAAGKHVEVTYVCIPGMTMGRETIERFCAALVEIDPNIPVHYLAHVPHFTESWAEPNFYGMISVRNQSREAGLPYSYAENNHAEELHTTYCPQCEAPLIVRDDLSLIHRHDVAGACPACRTQIPLKG